MRKPLLGLLALCLFCSISPAPVSAAPASQAAAQEPVSGAVVCPPGIFDAAPDDCQPFGPSEYLKQMAESGIEYPPRPFPAYPPSPELTVLPFRYFRVNPAGTPLYVSLDSAMSDSPSQYLAPGLVYVSYKDRADTYQGVYYNLRSGAWIQGDGERIGASTFQGLLFSSTPHNSFGWILDTVRSRTAPGFNSPLTGRTYYRLNIVQVYKVEVVDNMEWNLIGPDEWVEALRVARVDIASHPPDGVPVHRWIEVNLNEQTLAVYDFDQLVFATLIASGLDPFFTQPGVFQIYQKLESTTMSGAFEADRSDFYYLEDVPWTMYYDDKRALHGSYWRTLFGYPQSHGCVNLAVGDAHWLFNWAYVGDWVWVHDPSGRTPTDPAFYGAGAP